MSARLSLQKLLRRLLADHIEREQANVDETSRRTKWLEKTCGPEGLTPRMTLWERAIQLLISDWGLFADHAPTLDGEPGYLLWEYVAKRNLTDKGFAEFDEGDPVVRELVTLNRPEVVEDVLRVLWEQYPQDAEKMALPRSVGTVNGSQSLARPEDATVQTAVTAGWHVTDLISIRDATISRGTLIKYAKKAGVPTPRRGQRNWKYPHADAERIIEMLSREFPNREVRKAFAAELERLRQITNKSQTDRKIAR